MGLDKKFVGLDKKFVGLEKKFVGLEERPAVCALSHALKYQSIKHAFVVLSSVDVSYPAVVPARHQIFHKEVSMIMDSQDGPVFLVLVPGTGLAVRLVSARVGDASGWGERRRHSPAHARAGPGGYQSSGPGPSSVVDRPGKTRTVNILLGGPASVGPCETRALRAGATQAGQIRPQAASA